MGFIVYNGYTGERLYEIEKFAQIVYYARTHSCYYYVKSIRTGKWSTLVNHAGMKRLGVSAWRKSITLDKMAEEQS